MLPNLKGGLFPMLAITGKPTREKMRKRMQDYLDVGIDQVMIYPRTGLGIAYLSAEWFDLCRNMVEDAAEMGVGIWLYDELNWPSGMGGGKVVSHNPEFASRQLVGRKVNGNIEWTVEYKEHFPHLLDQESDTCADLLNPEAMRYFINITHEAYAKAFGEYMGKTVQGFWTDEPSFYYGIGDGVIGEEMYIHYYDGIEEDYRTECGRNLKDDLAGDFYGAKNPTLWKTYYKVIGARFEETFFKACADWCDEHNIYFTGHLMRDETVSGGLFANGDPMKCLDRMSLPGIDETATGTTLDTTLWHVMKFAEWSSTRKGKGLAELFAVGPCDMPFAKLRQMLWLTAAHGVDHYSLAIGPVDVRGGKVKDAYFTSFSPMDPRFKEYAVFSEDAKQAVTLARTKKAPGIALRYPLSLCASERARPDIPGDRNMPTKPWNRFRKLSEQINILDEDNVRTTKTSSLFNGLTKILIGEQWPVRFIAEDEDAGDSLAVVEFIDDEIKLTTRDGKCACVSVNISEIDEATKWLAENCMRPAQVSCETGKLATEVLVETFADGSIVIINLTDKEMHGLTATMPGGAKRTLNLGAYGVDWLRPEKPQKVTPENTCASTMPQKWNLSLDRLNTKLCRFKQIDGGWKAEIDVRVALENVRMTVLEGNSTPELDGRKIEVGKECDCLPEGLKELYSMSESFPLAPGKHSIFLPGELEDYSYIPALYLAGDFAVGTDGSIGRMPKEVTYGDLCAQGLENYAGRVVLEAQITIPQEAAFIRLDTSLHPANLTIDEVNCGTRLWDEFIWKIPNSARGRTVNCRVELSTSLGNLFPKGFQPQPGLGNAGNGPGEFCAFGIMSEPDILRQE